MVVTPIKIKYLLNRGVKLAQSNQFVDNQTLDIEILKVDKDLVRALEFRKVEILSCDYTSNGYTWKIKLRETDGSTTMTIINTPPIEVLEGNCFTLLVQQKYINNDRHPKYEYMEHLRHK